MFRSKRQKEHDAYLDEINRIKEWKKEHLQDVERKIHVINEKDQEIVRLKTKQKEVG